MERFKPKPKRKLNREEITDILERNVRLFKEEESFVRYLVELAVYLLEYEYDWSDSRLPTPDFANMRISAAPQAAPEPATASAPSQATKLNGINAQAKRIGVQRTCPHCGTPVGDRMVCSECHNLVR